MKISASIIVESYKDSNPIWELALGNRVQLLANMLKTLNSLAIFDDIHIFTNDSKLIEREQYDGTIICNFNQQLAYNFNFLDNIKLHNECFSLQKLGKLGDIHLFLDIHYQLIQPSTIVGMFNTLMENRFAAKVIPVYKIDPHLYMEISGEEQYLSLWGQQGLDRQKHPPLFRTTGCCFMHCGRMKEMQPMAFPFNINQIEGVKFSAEDDVNFIDYVMSNPPWHTQ